MNEAVERSESRQLAPFKTAIQQARERFAKVASQSVNYDKEAIFAMQALMKTDYAMKVANQNPQSVRLAMINVASTGLTLNPANGYAYLVPRDGAIHLDISYKGLIKIATDAGSIVWARADVVYAEDGFEYRGPAEAPVHTADPFKSNRGEIVGAYCIAKTKDGDVLTEVMPRDEIEKIRSKSTAWTKGDRGRKGPWEEFFSEMCRKAVVKRASKTWPYTDRSEIVGQAIEIANTAEGGYDLESAEEKAARRKAEHDAAVVRNFDTVRLIRDELARYEETQDPDALYTVAQAWFELSQDDQMALYLAPSKGGIFTTKQRDIIKTKLPKEQA